MAGYLAFKEKMVDIFRYLRWAFMFCGSIISFIGFAWWYGKEGAPHWVKKPLTPLPKPAVKPTEPEVG
ncbi:hypothetical protein [Hymenobacter terrenus]|uniref:hypothetical protein n=1 Tax=Hymenobacter terrenus TaxID=1629124 RepID=UPI000A95F167|nr:hypothetical protein [Hymenobacter terrenus]